MIEGSRKRGIEKEEVIKKERYVSKNYMYYNKLQITIKHIT